MSAGACVCPRPPACVQSNCAEVVLFGAAVGALTCMSDGAIAAQPPLKLASRFLEKYGEEVLVSSLLFLLVSSLLTLRSLLVLPLDYRTVSHFKIKYENPVLYRNIYY